MTDSAAPPAAWPALLTPEMACAYLAVSAKTFASICTVQPVELGVRVVRYRRHELDAWLAALPARLPRGQDSGKDAQAAEAGPAQTPGAAALDKVARRTQGWQAKHPAPTH